MIPYIEILDKYTRLSFELVEPAEFWCELEYYGEGEFEIYARATERNLACLSNGHYVKIPQKPYLFVIEKVEKTFDAERGLMISATGRQAKAILGKRIINEQTQLANDLKTTVYSLVNKHAGANVTAQNRRILGLETVASTVAETTGATQVSYENLLTFTDELLKSKECGAEIYIDGTALKYRVYKGEDKSETVIFSQMFDNLLSSAYSVDESNYKNYAYIGGEGEGTGRVFANVGVFNSGIDLCEVFVDARDISSKYKDESGVEHTADAQTYKGWLQERGVIALAEYSRVETFNGDIDTTNNTYVFGVDYYLGDRVRVQDNRLGIYITPRILKYTINQTANEYAEKIEYGE